MPKQGLVEIVCVVDRSGSMESIQDDARGAFNAFLESQKQGVGDVALSLTLFNTSYEMRYSGAKLEDVKPFTADNYVPAGCTALLDAVAKTIDEVGERIAKADEAERPEKVLFVILTDGQENSSIEYTRAQVMERIQCKTSNDKWEFVFLAAGKDAFLEAQKLGIDVRHTHSYTANDAHQHNLAVQSLTSHTHAYRSGSKPQWSSKA